MITKYSRSALRAAIAMLVIVLVSCVASQAPKVQCDTNLRPINSASADKP